LSDKQHRYPGDATWRGAADHQPQTPTTAHATSIKDEHDGEALQGAIFILTLMVWPSWLEMIDHPLLRLAAWVRPVTGGETRPICERR